MKIGRWVKACDIIFRYLTAYEDPNSHDVLIFDPNTLNQATKWSPSLQSEALQMIRNLHEELGFSKKLALCQAYSSLAHNDVSARSLLKIWQVANVS